jgi:hypothetical protein
MTTTSFDSEIKQWVQLDNQLKEIQERTKVLREKRHALETSITTHAFQNDLANSTVLIGGGKLTFARTRVAEPLTFKYLEKSLSEIISNATQVKLIMDHIKTKREIKTIPEIKRFHNK